MKIGVISDTHGVVNPGVFQVFQGVDVILHAGDIGSEDVISELQSIAPVHAVKGNCDFMTGRMYPVEKRLELRGKMILMRHIPLRDPGNMKDIDIFVHGHTHDARNEMIGGLLVFNPGYAGPAKGDVEISVGLIELGSTNVRAWIERLR
ncbi:MAG: metallophosphoesterase family protein [Deltaproteobacteria bacterium]|nr:metallophosphoesterase family protein [Deltaproteobacteria bacterium]